MKRKTYCDASSVSDYDCQRRLPAAAAAAAKSSLLDYCFLRDSYCPAASVMTAHDKRTGETLQAVWHIFWTIVPTLYCFAIARLATQLWKPTAHANSALRYAVEFGIIVLPTVLSVNVANAFVGYIVLALTFGLVFLVWRTNCLERARSRQFEIGRRPCMLTLARATINYLTALCILAIDFESFPTAFRKSRRFGASLMDVGIGLFVFAMGTVSRRPCRVSDLGRLLRVVAPVLVLGFARTVVIMAIDYHQDEHEYGVHLNAFFTLGLTKLFGTLLSALARSDVHLLPLGLVILVIHEIILQLGLSNFVMDRDLERDTFWTANREGLCSLPGFIGIYIISMYIGHWLQSKDTLNFSEFIQKLKSMTLVSVGIWMLVINTIVCIGIARVTCNFGYAAWILGIAVTMTLLFMIVFDLILNTLWPVKTNLLAVGAGEGEILAKTAENDSSPKLLIPTLVEAVNLNGLTFFLLANVTTGGVNIFLKPENRSNVESVLILSLYMLISTGFVYILFRLKIRIA